MRKKYIVIICSITAIFILPFLIFAFDTEPQSNCCELKHDITAGGTTYAKDETVAEPGAVICYSGGADLGLPVHNSGEWGAICFEDTVHTITDWVFWFFVALVTIMGVYVGIMFMTAGGDPTKQQKARDSIKYVVIGIVVAIAVRAIPALVRSIMGM